MALNVLLVEDSPTDVVLTEEALSQVGQFQLKNRDRLTEALRLLSECHFDVVLLDLGLPDSQGLDTLRTLRRQHSKIAVIVLTGQDDEELAVKALQEGAEDYLVKNWADARQLQRAIRYSIERVQTAERLRESEERFRLLVEGVKDYAIMLLNPLGNIMTWNAGAEYLLGYQAAEIIGQHYSQFFRAEDVARGMPETELREAALGYYSAAGWRVRKDGSQYWSTGSVTALLATQGTIRGFAYITKDLTEHKRTEDELRLRDRAIQAVSQGILLTDPNQPDNPVIYASSSFEHLTGYTAAEVLGRNCRFLQGKDTNRDMVATIREAIRAERPCTVEILNYRKSGTAFWNSLSISPVLDDTGKLSHFVGVVTDVTERRQLEEQFRQAQKMEAVGRMAAGVAHDFNNILTVINGFSELIRSQLVEDDPLRNWILEIGKAGERGASLTRQLLAFSRKQVLEPKVLNLNRVVTETSKMLERLIGEDVDLITVLEPTLGRVKADPGQIEQILINLAVNARDAMPRGGKLTIETANVELDTLYAQHHADLQPGPYVLLAVSDTGCGMDDATKARIFEPFFTTKESGKGTGLGLSTVFGIVKQSEGHITVYSEFGHGSSFKVYLPRVNEIDSQPKPRLDPRQSVEGDETILVAEDEPVLRTLTRHILERCGYTVLEAAQGDEALHIAGTHQGTIHLLITDVVMPQMSGQQLADRLIGIRPGVKVLFVSGYTDEAVVRHGVLQAETVFLQKPFTPTALAQKVREILDR